MTYEFSLSELKQRRDELVLKSRQAPSSAMKMVYDAQALYHGACILRSSLGVPIQHPAVKLAERVYVKAVSEFLSGTPYGVVVSLMMRATTCLYGALEEHISAEIS